MNYHCHCPHCGQTMIAPETILIGQFMAVHHQTHQTNLTFTVTFENPRQHTNPQTKLTQTHPTDIQHQTPK